MSDWRDVMAARADADQLRSDIHATDLNTNDPGLCAALLAIAAEIRALAILIDYAKIGAT